MGIPGSIRPVLARVVAALVAAGIAALARHGLELQLDESTRGTLTDLGVALILGVWGVVYAAVHKAISVKTNPTDAASPKIASVATGPLGDGQRTALATTMQHAASSEFAADPTKPPSGGF